MRTFLDLPKVAWSSWNSHWAMFSLTFLGDWFQELQKSWRDSCHGVTGESSLGQQERQAKVEALLQPDVPAFAPDQLVCRGLGCCRHGLDQLLETKETFKSTSRLHPDELLSAWPTWSGTSTVSHNCLSLHGHKHGDYLLMNIYAIVINNG